MKCNYPEYILKKLREWDGLEPDDDSKDEEFQELLPETAFDRCLEWEGLINHDYLIHSIIEGVYGVSLRPDDFAYNDQSRQDFVRGFGNIIRAMTRGENMGVKKMELDENEIVTVTFAGGGTHKASIYADSLVWAMYDIIKQALN